MRLQVRANAQTAPSFARPLPPSRMERPTVNVRQELRSHGVLLKETNKRTHAESSSNEASQRNLPSEEMECQPSTSGQRSGQSSSDSQVCDELHTNSYGATNMMDMGVDDGDNDAGAGSASNVCFSKPLGQRSGQRSVVQPNAANLKFTSPRTKLLQKSRLNQAHMGQLGPRKGIKTTAGNAKLSQTRDAKCLCSSQPIPRTTLSNHLMQQYVLDISTAISSGYVTWQPIRDDACDDKNSNQPMIPAGVPVQHGPPTEMCFSSVCEGRGELIMFGGVLDDSSHARVGKSAVNTVYYAL